MVNEFYYDHAKEDLLKLYIAMEEGKESVGSTEVTMKYGKGKSVKLKNKDNSMVTPDASVQSNIKPTKHTNNRYNDSVNNGDISKPINRQLEHNNRQVKQANKE